MCRYNHNYSNQLSLEKVQIGSSGLQQDSQEQYFYGCFPESVVSASPIFENCNTYTETNIAYYRSRYRVSKRRETDPENCVSKKY